MPATDVTQCALLVEAIDARSHHRATEGAQRYGELVRKDKGLIAEAARQPGAPPDFPQRADYVLTGLTPDRLASAVERAAEMVADVRTATA